MHFAISFIKYPLWLIIFVSSILQLFFIKKLEIQIKYFLLCILFNLGFVTSIFFTFELFDFMLRVSLDRLMFQTSGFYIALIFLTYNNFKLFKK